MKQNISLKWRAYLNLGDLSMVLSVLLNWDLSYVYPISNNSSKAAVTFSTFQWNVPLIIRNLKVNERCLIAIYASGNLHLLGFVRHLVSLRINASNYTTALEHVVYPLIHIFRWWWFACYFTVLIFLRDWKMSAQKWKLLWSIWKLNLIHEGLWILQGLFLISRMSVISWYKIYSVKIPQSWEIGLC